MTTKEYAIQCIKDEAQALLDLIPHIDKDFEKAAVDCQDHNKGQHRDKQATQQRDHPQRNAGQKAHLSNGV